MTDAEIAQKLDAIDPDWPSKFLSTDAAARFYREELGEPPPRCGFVIHSSPFEPPTICDCADPFCEEDDHEC